MSDAIHKKGKAVLGLVSIFLILLTTKFLTGQDTVQEYNQVQMTDNEKKHKFHQSKSTVWPTHSKLISLLILK